MKGIFGYSCYVIGRQWGRLKIHLRTRWYQLVLKQIGKSTRIYGPIRVHGHRQITLGSGCTINEDTILNARYGKITIGNHVRISSRAVINTAGLNLTEHYSQRSHWGADVRINNGVWICSGAIINPGVTIGEGSVVAAGAVVTKDVEPFTLVAGVPARLLRRL